MKLRSYHSDGWSQATTAEEIGRPRDRRNLDDSDREVASRGGEGDSRSIASCNGHCDDGDDDACNLQQNQRHQHQHQKFPILLSLSPLSHQPEYLHPYLVRSSSSSLSLCYPSRLSNSDFLYQIFNADLIIAAYSYSSLFLKPLSLSSPPPLETTPKATPSDLLSLLGPNRFSRRSNTITDTKKNPFSIKVGMTQMLRGGAILEVTAVDRAKLAEDVGACTISELRSSAGVAISARP
ncbi:hypothetical protein TIFTF001_000100 [Ficus carica]|uniref:PdxS/SNZ N-terminal domain-containing protein n=1 Tax=Ficus carica TaxID=3494 RepID=A0AA87Z1J7_FICCA|nr:hypothetical protein TIFTF001_000100 [Ficus carica]